MGILEAVSASPSPRPDFGEVIVGIVPNTAPPLDAIYGLRRVGCLDQYDALSRPAAMAAASSDVPALKLLPVLFLDPPFRIDANDCLKELLTPLVPQVRAAFERQRECVEYRVEITPLTSADAPQSIERSDAETARIVTRITLALSERATAAAPTPMRLRQHTEMGQYLALSLMVRRADAGTLVAKLGGLRAYARVAGLALRFRGPCLLESFGLAHELSPPGRSFQA